MQTQRFWHVAALAAVLSLSFAASAAPRKPGPAKKKPQPIEQAAIGSDIELVHQLGKDKGEQLQQLVDRFNAENPGRKIVVSDRDWKTDGLPLMMILGEDDEAQFIAGKPRYKPLYEVMHQAGEKLDTLKPPPQMSPAALDMRGRLVALPVGLSTPIMYYNKEAFRKAGLNPDQPPRTWWDLQQALGQLYDSGIKCPYTSSWPAWVHVESISAWHNEPFAVGRGNTLAVNGLVQVKHLAMMSSWYKSHYLHIFGRRDEADAHFAAGECAVITSGSDAFPSFKRQATFSVGVAPLPYHDDVRGAPQNTLADGPTLWVTDGHKAGDYKLAAKFVSFLLSPEMQVEWQRIGGYLPLNRSGLLASSSDLLKDDLVNNRVAIQELTNKPVTPASTATRLGENAAIRKILDEELETVWENKKPAKEALDTMVARSSTHVGCGGPRCGRK